MDDSEVVSEICLETSVRINLFIFIQHGDHYRMN